MIDPEVEVPRWVLTPRGIARMIVLAESGVAALVWSQRHGARILDLGRPPASARLVELIEAGDASGAASLLDEHLARARELLAGALGGEPGPEAHRIPSSLPSAATA